MKFTLPKTIISNAKNLGEDKEIVRALSIVVNTKKGLKEIVCARWYMGRSPNASRVHCSLWLMVGQHYYSNSGYGTAGGWGYCKRSAAFAEALESAGVGVSESASGQGLSVVREQLLALVKAMGYQGKAIVIEH